MLRIKEMTPKKKKKRETDIINFSFYIKQTSYVLDHLLMQKQLKKWNKSSGVISLSSKQDEN